MSDYKHDITFLQFAQKKKNYCTYLEGFTIKVPDIEPTDSAKMLNKTRSAP